MSKYNYILVHLNTSKGGIECKSTYNYALLRSFTAMYAQKYICLYKYVFVR
jgi:hypothetical protein